MAGPGGENEKERQRYELKAALSVRRNYTGMKRMELADTSSKSSASSTESSMGSTDPHQPRFAVCLRNDGYPASLEPRKLYRLLTDTDAAAEQLVRVIDESGEDYLYPAEFFAELPLPEAVEEALLRAS
jgi:hypothetical protein